MMAAAKHASNWRLYLNVLTPSLIVVALVGWLAITSVKTLGAVRAYVGGESLWSKARADAVQHLRDYALTHDEQDFAQFERALLVPLGDRRAREGMGRLELDTEQITRDFEAGGNHPDDIAGMIELFTRFGDLPMFSETLDAWQRGDALIEQLQTKARQLRQQVHMHDDVLHAQATLREIDRINDVLSTTEKAFSASLGAASRITGRGLTFSIGLTALVLSLGSLILIRRTLQKQAAQQHDLGQANRRWELAVAGTELGLFEIDGAKGLVMLDARAAALYGLEPAPTCLARDEMGRLIAPDDLAKASKVVDQAFRSGELFKLTVLVNTRHSHGRHLETTGRRHDDDAQRLIGVVRDVTQEHARAQLAVERDAAEKVAESQRAFLSRLSHELRTPLNAILGFAQLMAIDRQHPLPPPQRKQVHWILDAGEQLLSLVEDVLDLSKVDNGEISIALQSTDMAAVMQASLALVDGARQRFEVRIDNRLPQPAPQIMADPVRLQQVLVNLLINACKYNKPGGHVTIEAHEEGDQVCIEIADKGIGLSAQDASELFQPFRRVASVSARVEGSGLGLYIVKQLVERMNGSVSVRSELGVGSCFTVRLPKA